MIETLPDEVAELFPFEPHWVRAGGYTLHYVDEGPRTDTAVVLLHGNPTWSFLYRNIIPKVVAAGYRVIAPDYLGCGRSDHARSSGEYAIAHHVGRTLAVLDDAGVSRAVFFLQDWGGPIGLGACLARPGLLAGFAAGNTFWGVGSGFHHQVFPWRALHAPVAGPLLFGRRPVFLDGAKRGMPDSCHSGAVWHGYRLPWEANEGPGSQLAWPRAISVGKDHPTQPLADALWEAMATWDVPVRFVWGGADPVFPPGEQGVAMRDRLPRGKEHEMLVIPEGRHFIQEWAPTEISNALIDVAKEAF